MLYTFELTESQLAWVTDYLDAQWQYPGPYDRFIWSVQRRITDDLVTVLIDCDEATAVLIYMRVS